MDFERKKKEKLLGTISKEMQSSETHYKYEWVQLGIQIKKKKN